MTRWLNRWVLRIAYYCGLTHLSEKQYRDYMRVFGG